MDSYDTPPKALVELMREDREREIFEEFKATPATKLHPGFIQTTVYDDQRAAYAPPPSMLVEPDLKWGTMLNDVQGS